MPIEGGFGTST